MKFLQKSLNTSRKVLVSALFFSLVAFILVTPVTSLAACPSDCGTQTGGAGVDEIVTIKNPINATSVNGLIKDILIGVIKIGIPLIAIAIIYSGFLFVTAQGKPGDIETAKRAFMYTLIGGAILLGAWAIAQLISDTVLSL
ncbi:MAG: pilin [Candidatus Nomurabacteria bacterium]|nr:pilin [Candidatus Nomurabacteria bacterium]